MKRSGRVFEIFCAVFLLCIMPKACKMEYVCDVIDSMPEEIYNMIEIEHPGWNIDQIAHYYMANRDSLETEMRLEQEYLIEFEEYRKNNPEEFEELW